MVRMTQHKKRAQPMHEIQANISSQKIQKSLQNIGLMHDVFNNSCAIQVNGNPIRIVHCKFCSLGHIVTNCPHCDELKLRGFEYQLSTSSEQDMDHLTQRVRNTHIPKMDVVPHQSKIFGVIPSNLQSKNFSFIVSTILELTLLVLSRTEFTVLPFRQQMVGKILFGTRNGLWEWS